MTNIVRTHTYFITFKEYKNKFLEQKQPNIIMNKGNGVLTRTHIIFK